MASVLMLFLVLVCSGCPALAVLGVQERAAVGKLAELFPSLQLVSPVDSWPADGPFRGESWTSTILDNLCEGGIGMEAYGLMCAEGHIIGILLYVPIPG